MKYLSKFILNFIIYNAYMRYILAPQYNRDVTVHDICFVLFAAIISAFIFKYEGLSSVFSNVFISLILTFVIFAFKTESYFYLAVESISTALMIISNYALDFLKEFNND